jgi:DNA (cytosine-5)-methyltransferase 1
MIPYANPEYVTCPTGLVLPKDVAEQRYFPRLPTAVDLFCGCGGFGLGFIQAGFEVVAASDWDVPAAVTYMVNLCRYGEFTIHFIEESDRDRLEKYLSKSFKKGSCSGGPLMAGSGWISKQPRTVPSVKHFSLGDIRKLTGARILDAIGMKKGEVDCVTGGPPCQGYSRAGKQNVMDPRQPASEQTLLGKSQRPLSHTRGVHVAGGMSSGAVVFTPRLQGQFSAPWN